MATKISRTRTIDAAPEAGSIRQWLKELLTAKDQQKFFKTRQEQVTKRLKAVVEGSGYTDDQGHIWYDLDEAVDGVAQLQMQRKVSQSLQEERAEKILKDKGLWEQCTTTITVIDQDAIMAARFEDKLTDEDIESMFSKTVNYALMTPKAK